MASVNDWALKAAHAVRNHLIDHDDLSGLRVEERIAAIVATFAEPLITQLTTQLAEQRAELTERLSEMFRSIPVCYDTPADHYREMARRLVEDRDVLKHRNRTLAALLRKSRRDDHEAGCMAGWAQVGVVYDEKRCSCSAGRWNTRVDAALSGAEAQEEPGSSRIP